MRHPIIIKIFSSFLNLITFLLASVVIVAFDSLHQSGDYTVFLIYTLPLPVAIAISAGTLVQLHRTSNQTLRMVSFFIIAAIFSLGWLYVIFVLLWGDFAHAFDMPLFYLWVVGCFVQLIYLDRNLPKPAVQDPIGLSAAKILANPIVLLPLLFALYYESKMYEKRKDRMITPVQEAQQDNYFDKEHNWQIYGHLRNLRYLENAQDLPVADNYNDSISGSLNAQQRRNMDSTMHRVPQCHY